MVTLDDYIDGYLDECVQFIRERHGLDKAACIGICEAGSSTCYAALHPETVKNLSRRSRPVDFHGDANEAPWVRVHQSLDPEPQPRGHRPPHRGPRQSAGRVHGPDLLDDDAHAHAHEVQPRSARGDGRQEEALNFLRMEKWIADHHPERGPSMAQGALPGQQARQGEFELGAQVDWKNITMPVLNVFAKDDHIIPPATTQALGRLVGSKDYQELCFPAGMSACSSAASHRGCWPRHCELAGRRQRRGLGMLTNKIVSADEAVAVIRDGDTVSTFRRYHAGRTDPGAGAALLQARPASDPPSSRRRRATARSAGSTGWRIRACSSAWSADTGLSCRRSGSWLDNAIEAYNLPLGCISRLYREIAARGPGILSKVGLRTFVDPRLGGGKLNGVTTEDFVELTEIEGETWLRYKAFPINVALIRGTTADPAGHHHGTGGADPRQPRHRHGGQELAGARDRAGRAHRGRRVPEPARGPDPRRPGGLVVVAEPENHRQTYATAYNHAFSGRQRVPLDRVRPALDERKIVARLRVRAAARRGESGIGMPEASRPWRPRRRCSST